jgi:NAD(P)-dependent dehydrogenase (short-subunit alcohol dehydrogenase family)
MLTTHAANTLMQRIELGIEGFRSNELTGQVVAITGGGRGVGRMAARALAGVGAAVGVLARSPRELEETVALIEAAGGVALAATADVTDPEQLADALAHVRNELGPIDLLINNAGILGPIGPTWEVDASEWWNAMEVNVRGMLLCTQLVLPDMVARRHGRILNLASQAGVHRWPLLSGYSVSKAAVAKFSENVAQEARRYGVTILSVHPGLLPIGLSEHAVPTQPEPGSYEAHVYNWVARQFADGHGADPADAMRLFVRLARGDGDVLSGRHVSVHDDLDALVAQIDVVRNCDLYVLRPERLDEDARRTA